MLQSTYQWINGHLPQKKTELIEVLKEESGLLIITLVKFYIINFLTAPLGAISEILPASVSIFKQHISKLAFIGWVVNVTNVFFSTANDPELQMIPTPEMIPNADRK